MTAVTSAAGSGAGRAVDGGVCRLAADVETGGGVTTGTAIVDSLFWTGGMAAVDSARCTGARPGSGAGVFVLAAAALFLAPASVTGFCGWRGAARDDGSVATFREVESIRGAGGGVIE